MTSTDMRGKLVKRIPGPREFYCDYGLRYPASMGASKGEVLKSILKGVYFDNNRQPFGGCFRDALRYAGFSDYKEVVALYANIKARKENGETASCSFPSGDAEDISGDDEEMVRVLFEKYAEEFFEDATKEGHAQTVRLLLENGVYIDGHVTIAALYGHTPIVKLLLEEGADVNLKHCFCGTPLRAAAGEGHREIMQLLLEAGADINHDDPVYYAVSGGRKEVVELLLEKGAIINAWGGTTASGKSTIAIATSKGHKEIEELLIGRGAHAYTYGYCTQGCLLGLVRGNDLDENCPNVSLHRQGGDGVGHAIDVGTFARLIQTQLKEALHLDQDCEPLGIQGARGALFKVTLAAYGYTVVGKGTVKAFMPDLLHEGKIYQRLTRLQGTAVPVYLENINLIEWYYPDVRVRILHMLLMSWGSNLAEEDESIKDSSEVQKEIKRTMTEVRRAGVDQMDVRSSNLLWNREAQRVMLIDFERAAMAKCGLQDNGMHEERVMQEMSPNKKRKRAGSLERKR